MTMSTTFTRSTTSRHGKSNVFRIISDAYSIWRQRRSLAQLDDHMLADLGLTRHQALSEASRPIWDTACR